MGAHKDKDFVFVLLTAPSLVSNVITVTSLFSSLLPVSQSSLRVDVPSTQDHAWHVVVTQ